MDKIINILLLIIIFVFDPLAIALVVAANFAFDIANRRNLYGELEEETLYTSNQEKFDKDFGLEDWDEEQEEVYNDVKDIEVEAEVLEQPSDWKTVHEEVIEPDDDKKEKVVDRILMKGPSKNRVLFTDGTEGFVEKTDDIIRYL